MPETSFTIFLYITRILIPLLSISVLARCYISMRRGRRREDPVIILEEMSSHVKLPVLYWENSIGRSKSCDIILPDATASRDHAVLMRRESGWLVVDTNSKAGTFVNGKKVEQPTQVMPGDVIAIGSTALMLKRVREGDYKAKRSRAQGIRRAPSPFRLLVTVTIIYLLLAVNVCFAGGSFSPFPLIPLVALSFMAWGLYLYSMTILNRVSFELETIAFLLCGAGIMLLAGTGIENTCMQMATMAAGIVLFCIMITFMGNLDRVTKWRLAIGIAAVALFGVNLIFGVASHGAKNWIDIGPVRLQPSEFIKIAFIFTGASTLDRLQTAKNLSEFIVFSGICIGSLFLMRDFGTALVFFITFLIIAFMRSGSIRTIILICSAAVLGAFMILQFRPYIAQRFTVWRHVWESANLNNGGMQQTRTLSYAASGGLFGMGMGNGHLKNVFAGTSDLVFGMLCEELGLVMALIVVFAIALFLLYARSDVTRSRSTFYSISACAAAGMLLFQTCLNIFGSTDVLPLTGVTLPFISAGGSSMMACWGLLAFIKASDERTYAARRKSP